MSSDSLTSMNRSHRTLSIALLARSVGLASIAASALHARSAIPRCDRRPLTPSTESAANRPASRLRILGVYDAESGQGVAGAEVVDILTGDFVVTADGGAATLAFLSRPRGTVVRIRKLGYVPIDTIFTCLAADTVDVTLLMTRGTALPAVVTTTPFNITKDLGGAATFEQRCHHTNVACLRGDSISRYPSRTLLDLLRLEGTVSTERCRPTHGLQGTTLDCGTMRAAGPGFCTPAYFLNGIYWYEPPSLIGTDSPVRLQDIAGVEIYRSGASRPARFERDPRCGSIAIWTR